MKKYILCTTVYANVPGSKKAICTTLPAAERFFGIHILDKPKIRTILNHSSYFVFQSPEMDFQCTLELVEYIKRKKS